MKITIEIPKEFMHDWKTDRFHESLMRMATDAKCCDRLSGNYESELAEMLEKAFQKADVC
jgi:hypothetical protein